MEVGGDSSTAAKKAGSSPLDASEESNVSSGNFHSNSPKNYEQVPSLSPRHVSSPDAYAQISSDGGMQNDSATQSPPIQTMGRSGGYDPNRIPSSIFASKPATPMEWSVASNESLFSIQMGNTSFSTEFIQLGKSGELTKSGELIFPSGLPPVSEAGDPDRSSEDMDKGSGVTETSAETTKEAFRGNAEDHGREKRPPAECAIASASSLRSDGSVNSTLSFAFPVLEGNAGRSSSVKVDMEKQKKDQQEQQPQAQPQEQPQAQPQAPEATQNSPATKWFSCFFCCSFCC